MANTVQYACDGCGATVDGLVRGKRQHIDSFQIKGSATIQYLKGYNHQYSYITRSPNDHLIFCLKPGFPCLTSFIDKQRSRQLYLAKKKAQEDDAFRDKQAREFLSKQAEAEQAQRLAEGVS